MIKKLFCLIAALSVSVSLPVTAAQAEYSLDLPDGFLSAASADDKTDLAALFHMSSGELETMYRDEGILLIAANAENTEQIRLSCVRNDFSESAVSFARLSDTELSEIAPALAGESLSYVGLAASSDGTKYIELTAQNTDSGGVYCVNEFLTVCSSKLYLLHLSHAGEGDNQTLNAVFDSLVIADSAKPDTSSKQTVYTILAVAGIAVFAAAAAVLTVTVIRDLRKKDADAVAQESENDENSDGGK